MESCLTDQEIITAVKSGNKEAFRQIIKIYESQVAATTITMLGKTVEAEDVGQEVFIQFYKNLDQFRGDSSIGTYLTKIAMNLSLNEIKRRKRKRLFYKDSDEDIADKKKCI